VGSADVLYLGDTALRGAAAYLAGLLSRCGLSFDYVPTFTPVAADAFNTPRKLYILSDYTCDCFDAALQRRMLEHVAAGAGLAMFGGWESFRGESGHWAGSPVADALPVVIDTADDRTNCDRPALVRCVAEHAITAALPWDERPPIIGGYNRWLGVKDGCETLLTVERLNVMREGEAYDWRRDGADPLLVVGEHGEGRIAALATDVAPHWVGPMVDWGPQRVTGEAPGAFAIEVGDCYARFFEQLIRWCGRL